MSDPRVLRPSALVTCFQFLNVYSSMKLHVGGKADSFLWYDNTKSCWSEYHCVGKCAVTPKLTHPKIHPYEAVCVDMCKPGCVWVCVCAH